MVREYHSTPRCTPLYRKLRESVAAMAKEEGVELQTVLNEVMSEMRKP